MVILCCANFHALLNFLFWYIHLSLQTYTCLHVCVTVNNSPCCPPSVSHYTYMPYFVCCFVYFHKKLYLETKYNMCSYAIFLFSSFDVVHCANQFVVYRLFKNSVRTFYLPCNSHYGKQKRKNLVNMVLQIYRFRDTHNSNIISGYRGIFKSFGNNVLT